MIKVDIKDKKYGNFQLKNICFQVKRGEFLTILGKSGSGKSTILNIIAGLENEYNGRVLIDDITPKKALENKEIGVVFQEDLLLPHLTLFENIYFGVKFYEKDKKIATEKVKKIIKKLNLEGKEQKYPNELSGGERQRCSIGRALVGNPKILLMDEPFSALDYNLKRSMHKLLKSLQKTLDLTVVFITHDREEAFSLSDNIIILHNGEIVEMGKPEKLYYFPTKKYSAKLLGVENIFEKSDFERVFEIKREGDYFGIRGEEIIIDDSSTDGDMIFFVGTILNINFNFGKYIIEIEKNGNIIQMVTDNLQNIEIGKPIKFSLNLNKIRVLS